MRQKSREIYAASDLFDAACSYGIDGSREILTRGWDLSEPSPLIPFEPYPSFRLRSMYSVNDFELPSCTLSGGILNHRSYFPVHDM